MPLKNLVTCFAVDPNLAGVYGHMRQLLKLRNILNAALASRYPALSKTSRVANLQNGTLIIYTENSASAAKMRQLTTMLIKAFRSESADISEIKVKVQGEMSRRTGLAVSDRVARVSK